MLIYVRSITSIAYLPGIKSLKILSSYYSDGSFMQKPNL